MKSHTEDRNDIIDKIRGVIYGHAIGDAIGLGTEFLDKRQVKLFYPDGFSHYNQIIADKHRSRWQKGEWTDDTDQMICILESILENASIIETDIAHRIFNWAYSGGRGLGNTVYNVISTHGFLTNPQEVAKDFWIYSGKNLAANGAVMRTSVLGVWDFLQLDNVKFNAENVAKITHHDPRCVGSCVAICFAISKLLQNETDYRKLTEEAIKLTKHYDPRIEDFLMFALDSDLSKLQLDEPKAIGYTLKALASGFWAMQQTDYKEAILAIVNEGGDADTNGAVAGGVLGAKFGFSGLPQDWIDGLRHKHKLDRLIDKLVALMIENKQLG